MAMGRRCQGWKEHNADKKLWRFRKTNFSFLTFNLDIAKGCSFFLRVILANLLQVSLEFSSAKDSGKSSRLFATFCIYMYKLSRVIGSPWQNS
jgi:hypothetical protein